MLGGNSSHTILAANETFPKVESYVEAQPLRISNLNFLTAIPKRESLPEGEFVKVASKVDVKRGIYEGGLKVWECSIDLVEYLLSSGIYMNGLEVLEVSRVSKFLSVWGRQFSVRVGVYARLPMQFNKVFGLDD